MKKLFDFLSDAGRRVVFAISRRGGLKPYGDELLTSGAAFWIFTVRIAIVIMATAEAVSWSYLGYFFGDGPLRYLAALFTGASVFLIVWIIDATFVTLDLERGLYERKLHASPDAEKEPPSSLLKSIKSGAKVATGVVGRIAIIFISLALSAPFLAQLIFFRDISDEMAERDRRAIAAKRAQLVATHDTTIAGLQSAKTNTQHQLTLEAAGKGPSGIAGRGPTVKTLESRVADLQAQVQRAQAQRDAEIRTFDSTPKEVLSKRYNIKLSREGIQARGEILRKLMENPTYTAAEWAIKGFLTFVFISIMILKLFQPRSVGIYYSEQLQDLFAQYRRGAFDQYLVRAEQSSNPMASLRFEDWCVNTYAVIRAEDEEKRKIGAIIAKHKMKRDMWRDIEAETLQELEPMKAAYDHAVIELTELEHQQSTKEAEVKAVEQQLAKHREMIADATRTMSDPNLVGDAFVKAAQTKQTWESSLALLEKDHRTHAADVDALSRRISIRKSEVAALKTSLATKTGTVAEVNDRLAISRRGAIDGIAD